MWENVNCIILSTNKKVHDTYMVDNLEFHYNDKKLSYNGIEQNLYIISLDEEIKEGDWCINDNLDTLYQSDWKDDTANWNKVIATTDILFTPIVDMINPYVPQIPQQFIEEYIVEYNKGNVIEDVEVEYDAYNLCCNCNKRTNTKYPECEHCQCEDTYASDTYVIKISKDNFISIRRKETKLYTREEVINLLDELRNELSLRTDGNLISNIDYNNWLKENL